MRKILLSIVVLSIVGCAAKPEPTLKDAVQNLVSRVQFQEYLDRVNGNPYISKSNTYWGVNGERLDVNRYAVKLFLPNGNYYHSIFSIDSYCAIGTGEHSKVEIDQKQCIEQFNAFKLKE